MSIKSLLVVLMCKSLLGQDLLDKDLFPIYTDYGFVAPGCLREHWQNETYNAEEEKDEFQPGPQIPLLKPPNLGCRTEPKSCPKTRYRSYDGSCNNLKNPTLGASQTPFSRLLKSNYGDGISAPTKAKNGEELPLARVVSLVLSPDVDFIDPKFTLTIVAYGHALSHEISNFDIDLPYNVTSAVCCGEDGQFVKNVSNSKRCSPIVLPSNDLQTLTKNVKCMNFMRSVTDRDRGCVHGCTPSEQINFANHFIDLSIVYGNSFELNQKVREFKGGRLVVSKRHGRDWLPQAINVTIQCTRTQSPKEPCYFSGDDRVNQSPQLSALQIMFLREHNRLADALAELNSHWNDETIFQEARRIHIAENQHVIYYEWLPAVLGLEHSLKNKLIYKHRKGFVNDYDESVDPRISNAFSTAAFRFFHSFVAGCLDLISEHRHSHRNIRLADWLTRPLILEQGNGLDDVTRGMATQAEKKADQFIDNVITQFMFREKGATFGIDLRAFDIHRDRDHGLASYNDFRELCGLPRAHKFEDFRDVISSENVKSLSALYKCPDDVELTVGGFLEKLVNGTLLGPVNLCIFTKQFYNSRAGDRFFYENGGKTGFSLAQLNEIRKASASRLFCDNANDIKSMQPRAFEKVSSKNAVLPCTSLPAIDLTLWKEDHLKDKEGKWDSNDH